MAPPSQSRSPKARMRSGPDENGQWAPFPARCADVLVDIAHPRRSSPTTSEPHRATVMVHTPEAALHDDPTSPARTSTPARPASPSRTTPRRRLACDAIRQTVVEDSRGVPIKLGRRTRTVPAHIFRLLKHRDRHCRAPGCNRTRGLHAHHRKHWADGGETDLDNLILLCGRHHRLVHEQRWHITGHPNQPETIEFRRPGGRAITPYVPPPLDPRTRERFLVSTS